MKTMLTRAETAFDIDETKDIVDLFLEKGFTYFDLKTKPEKISGFSRQTLETMIKLKLMKLREG